MKKTKSAATSTPKSGTKRGRPAKSVNEDDDLEETPVKKNKSASAKKSAAEKENGRVKSEPIADAEDENEDDFILT